MMTLWCYRCKWPSVWYLDAIPYIMCDRCKFALMPIIENITIVVLRKIHVTEQDKCMNALTRCYLYIYLKIILAKCC